MGLAIGSQWGFAQELADGRVREVLTDWSLPRSDLWAIAPAGRQLSTKARVFIDFVERQLRQPEANDA